MLRTPHKPAMAASADQVYEFGEWRLEPAEHLLLRNGLAVPLGPKIFDTLLLLVQNPGRLVTKDEFMKRVWPNSVVEDLALTQNISQLRKVFANVEAPVIETVPKRGYRFVQSVAVRERAPSPEPAPQVKLTGTRNRLHLNRTVYVPVIGVLLVAVLILANRRPQGLHASNFAQITNDGQSKQGPIVSDGLKLYFGEGSMNHHFIAQSSVTGGEVTALPMPLQAPNILDMTPQRGELLVGSSGPESTASETSGDIAATPPLWTFSLLNGALRRGGQVAADAATWSPDGSEMAFAQGTAVYRGRSDGSGAREIARLPGIGSWLRWSPDGSGLRLTVFDKATGQSSLWEVVLSSKGAQRLLTDWSQRGSECCGSWTLDGKYFLFQSTHEGRTEIWALGAGKQTPVQLTNGQLNSRAPFVSANGQKLYMIGEQLRGELSRYDSKVGQFVPFFSGISAEFIDFSRDRQWVTYVTFPDQILWRSKIDGSERLQLTSNSARAVFPQWSPDGRRIAFFDVAPGKPGKIFLISSDGGTPDPLLNESRNEMDPTWSPDGTLIAFSYSPIFDRTPPNELGIFIVQVKSRSVQKLPGSDGLWAPRWSPDGQYIVARSTDPRGLMLYDFRSDQWSRIAGSTYVGAMSWSSDGRYIHYLRRGNDPAILRMRIPGGATEQIASLKGVRQTGYRGGFWIGLAPDDSPLVLRDIGTEEIYSLDLTTQ
jgi:Tol biopolymer transport system component/DNA-binding winged helix-turn-helix (wHTH) protein